MPCTRPGRQCGEPNPTSRTDWDSIDKLTVRLSFSQQKEDHKLELVDGMPTKLRYDSLDIGVTTTGEFGGMFRHIFEPDVQASFRWESWKKVRNHRVAVYGYTVAADHSQYFVEHVARGGEVQRADDSHTSDTHGHRWLALIIGLAVNLVYADREQGRAVTLRPSVELRLAFPRAAKANPVCVGCHLSWLGPGRTSARLPAAQPNFLLHRYRRCL